MSPRARIACLAVAGAGLLASGAAVGAPSAGAAAAIPPAPGRDPAACGMLGGSACYLLQWTDHVIEVLLPG